MATTPQPHLNLIVFAFICHLKLAMFLGNGCRNLPELNYLCVYTLDCLQVALVVRHLVVKFDLESVKVS